MRFLSTIIVSLFLLNACQNNGPKSQKGEVTEKQEQQEKTTAPVKSDSAPKAEKPVAEETSNQAPQSAIAHYICYTNDDHPKRRIWIAFNEESKASKIKYEGQSETIDLVFTKQDFRKGNAYPSTIDFYDEIYKGNKNGEYKLTHSGNWDYVAYTRGKDGKVFKFTIDHDANPYGQSPCF